MLSFSGLFFNDFAFNNAIGEASHSLSVLRRHWDGQVPEVNPVFDQEPHELLPVRVLLLRLGDPVEVHDLLGGFEARACGRARQREQVLELSYRQRQHVRQGALHGPEARVVAQFGKQHVVGRVELGRLGQVFELSRG
jgi:hypothetical protein